MTDLEYALAGYRLTTAEILYWMPDHAHLLQSFTWQTYDLAPRFPRMHAFLEHWREHIEATIHSVRLCCDGLVKPAPMRFADIELTLH